MQFLILINFCIATSIHFFKPGFRPIRSIFGHSVQNKNRAKLYHSVHFSVSRYYIFESWLTPCGTYDPIVRWSCNAESDARRPYAACDACQSTWSREKGADFSKCRSLFLLSTSPLPNKKASSQRPQHFLSKNILSTSHHASWAEKMTMRNAVWFHTAKATNQNANKSCGHSDLWDEEGFGGF